MKKKGRKNEDNDRDELYDSVYEPPPPADEFQTKHEMYVSHPQNLHHCSSNELELR